MAVKRYGWLCVTLLLLPPFVWLRLVPLSEARERLDGAITVPQLEIGVDAFFWANLMPIVPPGSDPLHALVWIKVHNHAATALELHVVEVRLTRADSDDPVATFTVEPVAGWHGTIAPGQSAFGEWRKTQPGKLLSLPCALPVVAEIDIRAVDPRGRPLPLPPLETGALPFVCAY